MGRVCAGGGKAEESLTKKKKERFWGEGRERTLGLGKEGE